MKRKNYVKKMSLRGLYMVDRVMRKTKNETLNGVRELARV